MMASDDGGVALFWTATAEVLRAQSVWKRVIELSDAAVAVLMIAHADAPGPADSPGPAATQIELTCAVATLARATQRHAYPAASQFRLYERVLDVDALDAWLRDSMLDENSRADAARIFFAPTLQSGALVAEDDGDGLELQMDVPFGDEAMSVSVDLPCIASDAAAAPAVRALFQQLKVAEIVARAAPPADADDRADDSRPGAKRKGLVDPNQRHQSDPFRSGGAKLARHEEQESK